MLPIRDDDHEKRFGYAQHITQICLSEGFMLLKRELSEIYSSGGLEKANSQLLAFQDALYAIIAEKDPDANIRQAIQG